MSSANSNQQKRIALVDCNNFFASCERVFHPERRNIPVAVLSHNDGRVIARSNEVKALGIEMGAPYFQVKELLKKHNGVIVSGNHMLYSDFSSRVMSILNNFTPELEIYSIDEAFLNLSDLQPNELEDYCRKIVKQIKQWTNIPVSIGIASTKVLAKAANRLVKRNKLPGGVLDLSDNLHKNQLLATLDIGDLWGVGRASCVKLKALGIHNALQLKQANPQNLRRAFGINIEKLISELNDVPCFGLDELLAKKQIIVSRSFGQKVSNKQHLAEAVTVHTTKAAEGLRQQASVAGIVAVFIATSPYNTQQPYLSPTATIKLPARTADTLKLVSAAMQGLNKIYQPNFAYAKAGVMLHDIQPAHLEQQQLFATHDDEKSQRLMATLDELNSLHGQGTIRTAREGTKKAWQTQKSFLSASASTCWDTLPVVQ